MREIIFDTETTGFDPKDGHRLVEFAGVEMIDKVLTGKSLHFYCNPNRNMPPEAQAVHGLSEEFLRDKPRFRAHAQEMLDFIGNSTLVAHNAAFDMRFLNFELKLAEMPTLERAPVVDTLELSRVKFPGAKHTLDALCNRFNIDRSARTYHGALIDAELLAEVYVELTGGRQIGLDLSVAERAKAVADQFSWPVRRFPLTEVDLAAHRAFLDKMKDPIWRKGA